METLLVLSYAAIVYAIFKVFKVPLYKWTVPTAVLGGIVMLGALILTMNYNHPYTEDAQKLVVGIPVVPQVTGVVSEVTDKINTPIKKGEILFKIDPTYYAQGTLQSLNMAPGSNKVLVSIDVGENQAEQQLPDGVAAQVAVYSAHHFEALSLLRKILLRMTSWMHYLYLDH